MFSVLIRRKGVSGEESCLTIHSMSSLASSGSKEPSYPKFIHILLL